MAVDIMLSVRALVVHDLAVCGMDSASTVDVLDDVIGERRWWLDQWPAAAAFVAGQIAQDVQDRLLDTGLGRWPRCRACDETEIHELRIEPDLGPDPQWVCERAGIAVAALGGL